MPRRSSWRRGTGRRPLRLCSKKEERREDPTPPRPREGPQFKVMSANEQNGVPIASVEQATGIARATLRIWERRYGFPQPGRDPRGERSYPDEQVRKLRLIAELMAQGHRPGRLVPLSPAQLGSLAAPAGDREQGGRREPTLQDPVLAALREHDVAAVLRLLEADLRRQGVTAFVVERMADLNLKVGQAWARGE